MPKINSYGKINIFLNVFERAEHKHFLHSANVIIDLHDIVRITKRKSNITIKSTNNSYPIPYNENNNVYKIVKWFNETYKIRHGWNIEINKKIPISSGLGGSSTNSSAVLKLLYKIKKITPDKSAFFKFYDDMPLFIYDKDCYYNNKENIIKKLKTKQYIFVLVVLEENINIEDSFRLLKIDKKVDFNADIEISKQIRNDFIQVSANTSSLEIGANKNNALFHSITGSAKSFFAAFSNIKDAKKFYNSINYMKKFIVKNKIC